MVKMLGLDDVRRETRALLEMEKDVVSGVYSYRWPAPGRKLCLDLYAKEDKSLKFYLDIIEGKRSSSIVTQDDDAKPVGGYCDLENRPHRRT